MTAGEVPAAGGQRPVEGADAAYEDREEEYAAGLRAWDGLPGIPASAGALIRDSAGRILLLKPTYKKGWTIPGGVMEADGETPWQACQRELLEETGLTVAAGRLAAVDTRPAKPRKAMGLRFLFDCGILTEAQIATITLQREELSTYAFVAPAEALTMLRPAVSRRVAAVLGTDHCRYLEDGRAVDGVPHVGPQPDPHVGPQPDPHVLPEAIASPDIDRTIEQIEGVRWPDPPADATALMRRCHELRRMPLGHLGVEDLRLLIAQDVGTEAVLPMALGMLRINPLLEGDLYPGDVLAAVLRRPDASWASHQAEADLLREALVRLDPDDPDYPVDTDLTELVEHVRSVLG